MCILAKSATAQREGLPEINSEIVFSIQFDNNSLINGIGGHNWAGWGGSHSSSVPGWPYRSGQIRPTDRCYLQYNVNDK